MYFKYEDCKNRDHNNNNNNNNNNNTNNTTNRLVSVSDRQTIKLRQHVHMI